uniref:Uncharacterized protein n=1 Tax=candidate division WOR-3 bacterium TaxID=2052148 RepID=A0A7V3NUA2_UNCW3
MVEEDNTGAKNNEPKTAGKLGQELIENIQNTEFGSPVRLAWMDFFDRNKLVDELYANRRDVKEARENSKDTLDLIGKESDLRIVEMKTALLENDIRRREAEVPGYSEVSRNFDNVLGEIAWAAREEVEAKYPNDDESKWEERTEDLYQSIIGKVEQEARSRKGKQA